jgi:2-dehydropantoate 2-reductase
MKILICGAGAMGSLLGAMLTLAGHSVWLTSHWTEHIAAIRRDGLWVHTLEHTVRNVPLTILSPDDSLPTEVHIVFISVKSRQTAEAAAQAALALTEDGVAITMQNGLGNLEILAQAVGSERAFLGVTAHGATLVAPGIVRHSGGGDTVLATEPDPVKAQMLADVLTSAAFATAVEPDIDAVLWRKLLINVGINPLTAILNVPNGVLVENEAAQVVLNEAITEATRVARARGVAVPDDSAARALEVARLTASNISAMHADIRRGVDTEIDVMNGAVAREGERLGIATPVNRTLTRLIHAMEQVRATLPATE